MTEATKLADEIAHIDQLLEQKNQFAGHDAFVRMRRFWPDLKAAALRSQLGTPSREEMVQAAYKAIADISKSAGGSTCSRYANVAVNAILSLPPAAPTTEPVALREALVQIEQIISNRERTLTLPGAKDIKQIWKIALDALEKDQG